MILMGCAHWVSGPLRDAIAHQRTLPAAAPKSAALSPTSGQHLPSGLTAPTGPPRLSEGDGFF